MYAGHGQKVKAGSSLVKLPPLSLKLTTVVMAFEENLVQMSLIIKMKKMENVKKMASSIALKKLW